MVVNTNKVLDGGVEKYLPEVKMTNTITTLDKLVRLSQREYIKPEPVWDSDEEDYIQGEDIPNPTYNPRPKGGLKKWIEADDILLHPENAKRMKDDILNDPNLKKSLFDYFGIIPFNPCVMINISPNWKGLMDLRTKESKWHKWLLDKTITDYLNACNRYSKYRYCIECGGEGDFLHAHIVAEINPDLAKSVKTHINKGNHKYEIEKMWKKNLRECKTLKGVKGIEGFLKGKFAVQRILLNNIELRDDKLSYLVEANKPEGHTNLWDLQWVKGDF